jgi:electron transfer flavoprotein alpha subunit
MKAPIRKEEYRGVCVFVEQIEGDPVRVSLELLGKGRQLADKLRVGLSAVLIGENVGAAARELICWGADKVVVADDPMLGHYGTEPYTDIISEWVGRDRPEILLLGASPVGRDLAPRLSFRLNTGCTADCTGLDIDEENRLLVSTRPAFGGNVMATIVCPEHRPQMSTVRPGVMPLAERDDGRTGKIIHLEPHLLEHDFRVKMFECTRMKSDGGNIQEAERIVSFGSGAADQETLELIKDLAGLLDAEVAGSRPAVEAGWIPHERQVGQTGKTIRPGLYMAFGISGAVQHTAGMSESKVVVAINTDPDAEIFKAADFAIKSDARTLLHALVQEIRKFKK